MAESYLNKVAILKDVLIRKKETIFEDIYREFISKKAVI